MDHSTKVWSDVAKWFQRRIFFSNCGRTDDGRKVMTKAQPINEMALCSEFNTPSRSPT